MAGAQPEQINAAEGGPAEQTHHPALPGKGRGPERAVPEEFVSFLHLLPRRRWTPGYMRRRVPVSA